MDPHHRSFVPLGDPRLALHATSAAPVWLFAGERLLWANAQAAAVLGFATPAALVGGPGRVLEAVSQQLIRLAGTLATQGTPRLERLRGLGAGGAAMACACARLTLADGTKAVLVVGTDAARPVLPLAERVRRWLKTEAPAAVYAPSGDLIAASADVARQAPASLARCGADSLLRTALDSGFAEGSCDAGALTLERLGEGAATVLVVQLLQAPSRAGEPAPPHAVPPDPVHGPDTCTLAKAAETPAPVAPALPARPPPTHAPETAAAPSAERRPPLRFVWQLDAARRFTLVSHEFAALAGAPTGELMGRTWTDVAAALDLDPEGRLEHAIASHDTFSGIKIAWPVAGATERLCVEMSGLPVFNRDRAFGGYRGFGVCRAMPQPRPLTATGEPAAPAPPDGTGPARPASATSARAQEQAPADEPRPVLTVVPAAKNVVPFRGMGAPRPMLTSVERTAFREIARALGARIEGDVAVDAGAAARADAPAPPPPPEPAAAEAQPTIIPSAFAPGTPPVSTTGEDEVRELRAILDTATDGVIVTDPLGTILSVNKSAEALFGYDAHELLGHPLVDLVAPESRRAAVDYLDGLTRNGVESVLNDGREVIGRVRQGGLIPLFMTIGRIGERGGKFCAVLRDVTQWKRAEEDLLNAKRLAEKASSAKSDFLAKISHEIRTPLNVIIGFSEVMMEERFGPIGNDRYRDYLRDIHASGEHVISLVNDLLDLSKIEAGKIELTFTSVNLNALVQQCVALMQPQANRERIIIRTSLAAALPPIVVDARSIRQIMLNLLSNSIKFTGAGGQVIVSTAFTERAEVILRVRDTGVGMSEQEIETAMQPFRQLSTSNRGGSGGTGLGLPLTKALAEANRASFVIKSAVNSGTLIEITFPATRVLAE